MRMIIILGRSESNVVFSDESQTLFHAMKTTSWNFPSCVEFDRGIKFSSEKITGNGRVAEFLGRVHAYLVFSFILL